MARNRVPMRRRGKKQGMKGLKATLPPRPPGPSTGYNRFVRNYLRNHRNEPKALCNAASRWRTLSPMQKYSYKKRSKTERIGRKQAVLQWNLYRKATLRPPTAYAQFMKELRRTEEATFRGLSFQESSRYTSQRWAALTQQQRNEFHIRYAVLMARYKTETDKVARGGALNCHWKEMEEGGVPVVPAGGGGGAVPLVLGHNNAGPAAVGGIGGDDGDWADLGIGGGEGDQEDEEDQVEIPGAAVGGGEEVDPIGLGD